MLYWSKSHLSNRLQFVNVNKESFSQTKVSDGVPQGSLLGPPLLTSLTDECALFIDEAR